MPGVYISFPFCAQKCTYCNFASGVFPRELEQRYLQRLESELEAAAWPWVPQTVYLGGGTPGSMDPEALRRLLAKVPGAPWRESTLEAAPGAILPESVRAWRDAGISRVSLGVQSFVDRELRQTGRRHDASTVARDVDLLRQEGIAEVNIDLIAGLPGQTAESWRESLHWIERLAPPHVSIYMFEIDEDSRLGQELLLGGVRYGASTVPDEQQTVDFYEEAVDRLAALGLARYEISNFARPGHESLHNLKYWQLEPYFGFGADAHSFDGRQRWQNVEDPRQYVESAGTAREESVPAHPHESLWVGLRLSTGITLTAEQDRLFAAPIARLVQAGLLLREGPHLRLTRRGVLLSNEVFAEFLEPCPTP
jgi:oxygen-independent coproporphyrinogen-3 oxidase